MTTGGRIAKNATALYAAEFVARALTLVLNLLIARKLGSSEFGNYAYVMTIVAIATLVADFGLSLLAVKEIAVNKPETGRLSGQFLALKTMTTLLVVAPLSFVAIKLGGTAGQLLALNLAALFILTYSTTISSTLRAHELMEYDGLNRIGVAFLTATIGSLLILRGYGIVALGVVAVGTAILSGLFMASTARRSQLQPRRPAVTIPLMKSLLQRAWPYAILVVLVTISFRIDMIMLALFKTPDVVGQYSAAYKLIEALLIIPGVIATVLFPVMSERFEKNRESLASLTRLSVKLFGILVLPIAVGLMTLAEPIIILLYGDRFPDSVFTLQILAVALIPTFLSAITSTVINSSDGPKINTYLAGSMAVFNILANIILIPRYSLFGAAINTVLTEGLGLILGTIYISKKIFRLEYHAVLWKPFLCSLVMGAVVVLFPSLWLVPAYALVYLLLLWLTGSVEAAEITAIKAALPKQILGTVSE